MFVPTLSHLQRTSYLYTCPLISSLCNCAIWDILHWSQFCILDFGWEAIEVTYARASLTDIGIIHYKIYQLDILIHIYRRRVLVESLCQLGLVACQCSDCVWDCLLVWAFPAEVLGSGHSSSFHLVSFDYIICPQALTLSQQTYNWRLMSTYEFMLIALYVIPKKLSRVLRAFLCVWAWPFLQPSFCYTVTFTSVAMSRATGKY